MSLDRLTKRYDGAARPSVDGVSLEVAHGEFFVLLGPSGCGKTTTLRMVAGLEAITSGTLAIDGRPVNGVPARDRDIAMVFQSYALYPHMSVAENLAFGLKRRDLPRAEIEARVARAAGALGLDGLLKRRPSALSGGQRQRVALGRAIVRDPKVFLFDEPLSNLDASLRASTRLELAALHARLGATMLYVTHDQVEAMTLGDRVCVMHEGRVAQVGPPLEVYRRPASVFVARFLGAPPMNVVPAELDLGGGAPRARLGGGTLALGAYDPAVLAGLAREGRGVLVGLRPEDVAPAEPGPETPAAEVAGVERLGAETVLALRLDGHPFALRAPRDLALAGGTRIGLAPGPDALHLFHPATGIAVPRP